MSDTKTKKTTAPEGVRFRFTATGRNGKPAYRTGEHFTHAADVDGKIDRFFPSKTKADAWAEAQRAAGMDVKIVAAKPAS